MLFTSDNWAGVHPSILEAMAVVNWGSVPAYGADDISKQAVRAFEDLFEQDLTVSFVATGSAANSLALACLCPPWGAIFTHQNGHIHTDECAAPEFFTGGAKIMPLPGKHGKLTPDVVDDAMRFFTPPQTHHALPKVLSLTQGTEAGTVYTEDEVGALCEMAKRHKLHVHMDGARFSNACARAGASPADLTGRAGVDVLTFGGTKNGCMVAEAIVFFNRELAATLPWRQKRAGQGFSKHRFLGAQWKAFLKDDLWLKLGGRANAMADQLSKGLAAQRGITLVHPTEINEVFVTMQDELADALKARGAAFYDWITPQDPYDGKLRRLVTSYVTSEEQVDEFLAAVRDLSN